MEKGSLNHRGIEVPEIGLGSTIFWFGNREAERAMEEAVSSGLISMVDCAEMYGNGRCEEAVGRVLGQVGRDHVYLIDKILPDNATPRKFRSSLEHSLRRLGTDHIDLYLLHWREKADLQYAAQAMTQAVQDGLILNWGVSNFDVKDMEDLFACDHGKDCFADQILYNLGERGVEYDLLPWLTSHGVLPMSYSSLGSSYADTRRRCADDPVIRRICSETGLSVSALMLAFNTRQHNLAALFSSGSFQHIKENTEGVSYDIDPYLDLIDGSFPPPTCKVPLAKL